MPRSVFLGRVVGAGEPLWTDSDRAWALALLTVEEDTCRGCGQPLTESTDADAENAWTAEVIRCHACTTAHQRSTQFQKDGGDLGGAHIHVRHRR
ncbi:hypothetical protein [Kitasatospora sp. NPDC087314]|uniref:hypothetical protein n=1 Tax=Kitasatospora sp. NPDC087314 TaxID=3364068 RepID=UPI00382B703E